MYHAIEIMLDVPGLKCQISIFLNYYCHSIMVDCHCHPCCLCYQPGTQRRIPTWTKIMLQKTVKRMDRQTVFYRVKELVGFPFPALNQLKPDATCLCQLIAC
jgi:hypothetical protein